MHPCTPWPNRVVASYLLRFGILLALTSQSGVAAADGQVTVRGRAQRSQLPQVLRVYVHLSAAGDDITTALAKLSQLKATAAHQLTAAGAIEASLRFGETRRLDGPKSISKSITSGSFSRRGNPPAEAVRAAVQLSADWWLAARNQEELLVVADRLRQRISEVISPGSNASTSGTSASCFGQPRFSYVGWLGDQQRADLLLQACHDARKQAAVWATAVRQEIGTVVKLESPSDAVAAPVSLSAFAGEMKSHEPDSHRSDEVSIESPQSITYQVSVEMTYSLQDPRESPPR